MAASINIYLQQPLLYLDIDTIKKGIADADLYTLAEDFSIEEDKVRLFMANLQ